MRNFTRLPLIFSFAFLIPIAVVAQPLNSDIRPMLKSLTLSQKLQVLDYFRHLGLDMDNEIQFAFEQVSRTAQAKSVKFIETLKKEKEQNTLTKVNWNRDTLFFNDLIAGTPFIDSFIVTNTGNAPYLISGTKTTCDCTVLQLTEHPIMPGESAVLRVEFNSSGKLGTATPAIIVYDNSIPNKRNILYLKGNIIPPKKLRKYPWD